LSGAPPFGVILAGGAGRRLGGADKALIDLGGRPLLAHVAARLAPQCGALALSANGDPARFAPFGLAVLPDPPGLAGAGPLAGVLAGLGAAAAAGFSQVLTAPVDAPFLPGDLGVRLAAAGALPALAATGTDEADLHPTFALWPVAAAEALAQALAAGRRTLRTVAAGLGAARVVFPDPSAFLNINTPADLAAARQLAEVGDV
jgi:molybdopterin-guanine dinucleotide biosynthesis protein A